MSKHILIVSDSHGRNDNLHTIVKRFPHLDMMLHLGDSQCPNSELEHIAGCPVEIVRGNCDWNSQNPALRVFDIDGLRIFMTHGHNYSVNYSLIRLVQAAREQQASIAMFGHTHIPIIDEQSGDVTVINPGSITLPRQEGHCPSFINMEIDDYGVPHFNLGYL